MKALIVLLIIAGVFYTGRAILRQYKVAEQSELGPGGRPTMSNQPEQAAPEASNLAGLPPNLETALANAERQGAAGLRNFLLTYSRSIKDPRLAAIELDYVVLLSRSDPTEAKRVFESIRARTLTSSPVYPRIKQLEKTFQ